jgi:hypothetical protein
MNTLVPICVTLVIALLFVAKVVQAVSLWPPASARVWPWLRLQSWWPVVADHNAESLLRERLSADEYRQLCARAYLDVRSHSYNNRIYRVPRGPGQVLVLEGGRVVERLCVQPVDSLPEADVILMHKLLIESDERTYLETANHFPRSVWR